MGVLLRRSGYVAGDSLGAQWKLVKLCLKTRLNRSRGDVSPVVHAGYSLTFGSARLCIALDAFLSSC
jgi:hypothetical protein